MVSFLPGVPFLCVGGMPSSGSTLCFNIFRELYESVGKIVGVYNGDGMPIYVTGDRPKFMMEMILLKNHLGCSYADININVCRDIRDSVASTIRRNPNFLNGDVIKVAQRNMEWHDACAAQDTPIVEWVYEKYKKNPIETTTRLMRACHPWGPPEALIQQVITTAEGLFDNTPHLQHDNNDPRTLLTSNHRSAGGRIGSYRETLEQWQIEALEDIYGDWLRERGYME